MHNGFEWTLHLLDGKELVKSKLSRGTPAVTGICLQVEWLERSQTKRIDEENFNQWLPRFTPDSRFLGHASQIADLKFGAKYFLEQNPVMECVLLRVYVDQVFDDLAVELSQQEEKMMKTSRMSLREFCGSYKLKPKDWM